MKWLLLLAFSFSAPAWAYLPPAFYVYTHVADPKGKSNVAGVSVTISKPQGSGTEELLGTISLVGWGHASGGWPSLSLLFENDHAALIRAVTSFGIPVPPESALLRVDRDRIGAMRELPKPFYKPDHTMALKRTRKTYAWVHSDKDETRSVWIEKDSFLPLKIAAPCPSAAAQLSWAKAGENKCELEFRNLGALRRGSIQSSRMILWKDGAPLLFFTFDKVSNGKDKLPASDGKLSSDVKAIAETVLH